VARVAPIVFYAAGAGLILFALVTSGADRRRDRPKPSALRGADERSSGARPNLTAALVGGGVALLVTGGVLDATL
jgi:hypothetical protein